MNQSEINQLFQKSDQSRKEIHASLERLRERARTASPAHQAMAETMVAHAERELAELDREAEALKADIPVQATRAEALADVLQTEGGFVNYQGQLSPHRWFAPVIVGGVYLGLVPLYRAAFRLAPVALQDDFRVHRVKLGYLPVEIKGPGEGTTTTYEDHLTMLNRSMLSTELKMKFIGVFDASTGDTVTLAFD